MTNTLTPTEQRALAAIRDQRARPRAITHDAIPTATPRAPRRTVVGWGMGEVAVIVFVALAIVGAFTLVSWIVGR